MARTTDITTISFPPQMTKLIEKLMKEEGRTKSELIREAVRRYGEEREWKSILQYGKKKGMESGIAQNQIEGIVDEYRT
jgi:CopG family transcriptional regulator / antitoxin EndoAI